MLRENAQADGGVCAGRCSCQCGITGAALGMLGKVWSSGALQVVQNVAIIPHSVHPRDKLEGGHSKIVKQCLSGEECIAWQLYPPTGGGH